MTKTAKMTTIATLALVASIALMFVLQANAPDHAHMLETAHTGAHAMGAMWSEMGWLMALGPIAGILLLGSMVTFITLFVRWLGK